MDLKVENASHLTRSCNFYIKQGIRNTIDPKLYGVKSDKLLKRNQLKFGSTSILEQNNQVK